MLHHYVCHDGMTFNVAPAVDGSSGGDDGVVG